MDWNTILEIAGQLALMAGSVFFGAAFGFIFGVILCKGVKGDKHFRN
jgi:hypothetical protein